MPSSIQLLLLFLSNLIPFLLVNSKGGGFSTDLIHRDSPKSPFYNPNLTPSERLHQSIRRQLTRKSIQSNITAVGYEYLMSVNIGTPPLNILAIADTGSDLTWTQCEPCVVCYEQNATIYDSTKSSTYRSLPCSSESCAQLPVGGCSESSTCEYRYSYGDNSYTVGVLSSETFLYDSDQNKTDKVSVPNLLFGCSRESNGTFDASSAGIVGLGAGPLSLVSQLGDSIDYKFSYCLVPNEANGAFSSILNFGDKADVGGQVVVTPLVLGEVETYYYLTLESIAVGDDKVEVGRKDTVEEGNIIIDSGTTLTILEEATLQALVDKVSNAVKYPKAPDPDGLFDLCFEVSDVGNGTVEFPDLTFRFKDASVTLKPLNTFVAVRDDIACFAMVSSNSLGGGIQIFGNIAQQNMHVGYDLKNRKLSIASADCTKISI